MKLTLSEIAGMSGGKLLSGDPNTAVTTFFTDSRQASPGAMFVPIRGENVDGHAYIPAALESGAAASFTDHPVDCSGPLVQVDDCRAALQKTAAAYRERFRIPIVGITGSVGKTTAKEMVAQALTARHNVWRTPKNANSQVGVPITVCSIGPEHTAAVIEMGVSMPGEMERIAQVVKPTCGIVTTIGTSHIEFMKSRKNILAEKSRMADYLLEGAPLFVNGDNDLLAAFDGNGKYRVVKFGLGDGCAFRAVDIAGTPEGVAFTCLAPSGNLRVELPVPGEHNVRNALAAIAVAEHLGQSLDETARALRAYTPPAMRQQFKEAGGVTILDDSYNASPDSMCSALDVLTEKETNGRRWAVLAGMNELGGYARQGHLETGAYAREKGIDCLIAVGELGGIIAEGFGPEAIRAKDNQEAAALLLERLRPGDSVLVKGSRGMKTEEIVAKIMEGYQ